MAYAPSEDSDQPGHPPRLLRVFAVRMKKPWVLSYPLSAQRRLWADWADAQADPSLRWAHSHFVGFAMRRLKWCLNGKVCIISSLGAKSLCWFCHEAAHVKIKPIKKNYILKTIARQCFRCIFIQFDTDIFFDYVFCWQKFLASSSLYGCTG